jgi:NTE family protein
MVRRLAGLGLMAALLAGCAAPRVSQTPVEPAPAVVDGAPKRPPRIGLALGGGAAKGFAHVGVIAVLEEAGIVPDYVVGTSAGSLVGALYASGMNAVQLQQTALRIEEVAIADWMVPIVNRGLFRGEALARYVNESVAGRLIEDMRIPLGVVAVAARLRRLPSSPRATRWLHGAGALLFAALALRLAGARMAA